MNPYLTLMLLVLVAIICLPESKQTLHKRDPRYTRYKNNGYYEARRMKHLSRCIRQYGHSCLGGQGKRSLIPPLPSSEYMLGGDNYPIYENSDEELSSPEQPQATSDHLTDESLELVPTKSHDETLDAIWRQLLNLGHRYYDQESQSSANEAIDI